VVGFGGIHRRFMTGGAGYEHWIATARFAGSQTIATTMEAPMNSRGMRVAKGTACGILMLAYAYGFRQWIAPVLKPVLSGYPVFAQKVGVVLALLPIWLLATYVATRLLPRSSAGARHRDERS